MRSGPGKKRLQTKGKKKKYSGQYQKNKGNVMNPIWRRLKKRSPSSGQNGQLVHWWLLVHSASCRASQQFALNRNIRTMLV
jgi:hypothetical protein